MRVRVVKVAGRDGMGLSRHAGRGHATGVDDRLTQGGQRQSQAALGGVAVRHDYADLALLIAVVLFCIPLVNPRGDFPLNDDWAYGLTARFLAAHGAFRPTDWGSMTLLTNAAWGALFCPGGSCSFTALRASTLCVSLCGGAASYALVAIMGGARPMALVAGLAAAFNPLYFLLSYTFMTDVLFYVLCTLASVTLLRAIEGGHARLLWVGAGLAAAATLSRQIGLCVPAGFLLASMICVKPRAQGWLRAALPLAISLGALRLFEAAMRAAQGLPARYNENLGTLRVMLTHPALLAGQVFHNAVVVLMYLGLFSLPAVLVLNGVTRQLETRAGRRGIFACLAGLLLIAAAGLAMHANVLMPLARNCIGRTGMGPLTLRDTLILGLPDQPDLPIWFWLLVTCVSAYGAACLLTMMALSLAPLVAKVARWQTLAPRERGAVFLLTTTGAYFAPVLIAGVYDRYMIVGPAFIAAALAGLAAPASRAARGRVFWPAVLLACLAAFAICGTHDYLAWNRARWAALRTLTAEQHVPAGEIDGGFEFNGLLGYDPAYVASPYKSWWWVRDPAYMVSFGALPGYDVVTQMPYDAWLPPHTGRVLVLRRQGG